jgi:hypothetical protein
MTVQLALALGYFALVGLPTRPVAMDPKKVGLLALIVIPVSSGISYGLCWLGLTSGIRIMEKQRERAKK